MSILYHFKNIQTIHTADQIIDIVLSKTQRKTPTEVHPGYAINRIRQFYMRKIKFCAETFKEKLTVIVDQFPQLSDIHPFFSDMLNILYDKDHYKIALSQANIVRTVTEKICSDYLKLIKFSDSLYRCKQLKIAAFGRMCTAVKRIGPSLVYLEEVRKHVGRLPSIDPYLPTILFFGFPNVGKSSLINKMTRANVEVSSMPFSTQNLYVGHTEFKNVKVQCIDSPGVLDRPLDQRNTIEMQSITALAHLRTLILFIIDISETCGYSLLQQVQLYNSLKPLLQQQQVFVALNKVDLFSVENLDEQSKQILQTFQQENPEVQFIQTTCNDDQLMEQAKELMCQTLLDKRLQDSKKGKQQRLQNDEDYYRGVSVVEPQKKTREIKTYVPQSFIDQKEKQAVKTLKQLQEEMGGPGVFFYPTQEHFQLENQAWKYDNVPEIMDGKNIFDFVDPDIERKLELLEQEQANFIIPEEELLNDQEKFENEVLEQVRESAYVQRLDHKLNNNKSVSKGRISIGDLKKKIEQKGLDSNRSVQRAQEKIQKKTFREMRSKSGMEIEESEEETQRGFNNRPDSVAERRRRKIQKKDFKDGQKGEGDRHVYNLRPKHLFSGKTGSGTRDRR